MPLACPGNKNCFNNTNLGLRTALATCISDNTFYVNSVSNNFSKFACKSYPFHTARYSGNICYDGIKRHIEVGFEVESAFIELTDICFDDVLYTHLDVKATIVSRIAGYQSRFPTPSLLQDNFFPGISAQTLHTQMKQWDVFSGLLGSTLLGDQYIDPTAEYYLARGQHSVKDEYVYGSKHRTKFHSVNVSPQWQIFNGGNCEALESSVRAYADKKKLFLVVYTGTYGVATLPNVNGIETELYLYVDSNSNKAFPLPKFYWKAVYDPKRQVGVVFVGINNPYVSDPQGDDLICNDVCSKISWVN